MAVVCGKCRSTFPQETDRIRSRTVNKIHDLAAEGKSIQDIAISLGIARNTVRRYLRHPELVAMPHPRPHRRSKLDPFKEQVRRWITEDHCYNCEAMLPRLLEMGYVDAEMLAESQSRYQVDLVGPVMPDTSWASKEAGRFDHSQFRIEWQAHQMICPAGQTSRDWGHIPDRHGKPSLRLRFPLRLCRSCPLHPQFSPIAAKLLILRPHAATYN